MRRRVVPALIALLAAALAAWWRRAGRAQEHAPVLADEAAPGLPEPPRRPEATPPTADAPAPGPAATTEASPSAKPEPLAAEPEPAASPSPPPAPAPPANHGPRFVSIPWTLVAGETQEQADRQELPIRFTLLGGRMELDRIDVRETDSQVFVTVLARYEPPSTGRASPHYGVARDATLRLARPLGDRALVHAPDQLDELTGRG